MRALNTFLGVFRRSGKVTAGVLIVAVIVLIGILHGQIVHLLGLHIGQNPLELGAGARFQLPGRVYFLGTDNQGRDELSMIVTGLWTSLQIGIEAGVISTVIGVVVAFYAAYRGGFLDSVLSTTTDLFLVIPSFPLLIAFSAFAKNTNVTEIALILAVFSWAFAARTIRSHVLSLRTRAYVDLARVSKEGTVEIIFAELMPNMLPYIALGLCYATIGAIFALVGLEVIGLGPSGVIDLGFLINTALGSGAMTVGVWPMFVVPIVILGVLFFALNMINLGLEEVFNPRLRKVLGG
ncbi:MAG: ABC transporter permease [Candidatus Dormibacteraeota bacterium]|nr:ABC transporter permease [Candidatus Dormibacteraeota bacterium]